MEKLTLAKGAELTAETWLHSKGPIMTNQQGAPEALRPITRYEVVDCIDSKHVPAVIPNKDGPWVRYEDHAAALVEAQQPTTHVQKPAEIEHVAGDVSKNGPESNMAQQPAPSAAAAVGPDAFECSHEWDGLVRTSMPPKYACKHCHNFFDAPPSTTPQADSQPAADEIVSVAREQGLPETEIEGVFRVNADDLCRVVAADRAARAPADSVLEAAALSSEQQRAIFEAYDHAASESYFEVRPQIDCNDRRRVFKAGYERGWDAARKQGGHK